MVEFHGLQIPHPHGDTQANILAHRHLGSTGTLLFGLGQNVTHQTFQPFFTLPKIGQLVRHVVIRYSV